MDSSRTEGGTGALAAAQAAVVQARPEADGRRRRTQGCGAVSNVQQPSRKVDVAAVGAERCCREALPAGDRVAARQLHLRST